MKCPIETGDRAGLLLSYSTKQLDAPRAAALEQHMAGCGACRDFVVGQRAVWRELDEWDAPAVSADFNRRLYQQIGQESSWSGRLQAILRPVWNWRAVPITAAACALVIFGLLWNRPTELPSPPQTPVVEVQQVEHALDDIEILQNFDRDVRSAAKPEL